jgi:AraC-like DNA-binding protein
LWDDAIARLGLSVAELYAEAGVNRCNSTTAFIQYGKLDRVLHCAECRYGPAFATNLVRTQAVADFDIVGYLFMNAPNLRSSLQSARDCVHVLNSHCVLDIETTNDFVDISYRTSRVLSDQHGLCAEIAALCLVSAIRRYLQSWDWSPVQTTFEHDPRENAKLLKRFIGGPVSFGQPSSGIRLPRAMMRKSSPHAEVRLFDILYRQVPERQPRTDYGVNIVSRVTSLIEVGVRSGQLSADEIADRLAVSKRTLYRRLQKHGTSLSEIRTATLVPIAKEMLSQNVDLATVAYRLGYSDCRSFGRAFKRATDMTPAAYRRYATVVSSTPLPALTRGQRREMAEAIDHVADDKSVHQGSQNPLRYDRQVGPDS